MSTTKPPEILDKIVDKVLAYRPKPKSKGAKKRKKLARKLSSAAPKVDRGKENSEH
jgi:hypothetical protein